MPCPAQPNTDTRKTVPSKQHLTEHLQYHHHHHQHPPPASPYRQLKPTFSLSTTSRPLATVAANYKTSRSTGSNLLSAKTYFHAPNIGPHTPPLAPPPISTHPENHTVRDENDDNLGSSLATNNDRSPHFTTTTSSPPPRDPSPSRDDVATEDPVDPNSIPLTNLQTVASGPPSRRPDNAPSPREAPGQPTRTQSPESEPKGSKPLASSPMSFLTKNIWPNDGRNRSHVPAMPVWIAGVRIAQLVRALLLTPTTLKGNRTTRNDLDEHHVDGFEILGPRHCDVGNNSLWTHHYAESHGLSQDNGMFENLLASDLASAWIPPFWFTFTDCLRFTMQSFSGTEGFPFSWFAFAWTFSYLTWLGVAVMFIPVMYNCWVHLGLELLTVVFWLITMALLASHADDLDSLDAFIVTFGPKYEVYYKMNVEPFADGFVAATFAGTATSVVNLVLFVITISVFGRALHALRKAKLEKAPSTTDSQKTIQAEGDKMVASPQMTSAVPTYIHWNNCQHPHAYAYYGQPYAQSPHSQTNPSPPNSVPPHGFQPAYFPGSNWPPQPPQQQPPPEGGVWPAQNYGMYQQQVPIGPQHTGQSGSMMGSPQFPMVQPMQPSKADLPGVYPTPPPGSATVGPGYPPQQPPPPPAPVPGTIHSPVELNDGRGDENMPAELPSNPPRSPR
ncbi:hypothetical protein CCUS01_10495 [Colletotrichum cuscutae]|uniref:Uncharacterized protein n=1 Tax=Colletotrichum cuscutae TaxID=1209917 RepID=A0AAI9UE99_9PEZI|nr:hypothetical protein CCUS01_10495 [Colletotrichum cuscutae]